MTIAGTLAAHLRLRILFCILPALFGLACDSGTGPSQVVLEPQPCRFVLSPPTQNAPAAGGEFSFTLTVSSPSINPCRWSATSSASWITLSGVTSGSSAGTVTYLVAANASSASRAGVIALGLGGFNGSAEFAVTQSGASQ